MINIEQSKHQELIKRAEKLLSRDGQAVGVVKVEEMREEAQRNLLLRLTISPSLEKGDTSVVLKKVIPVHRHGMFDDKKEEEVPVWDPENIKTFDALRFYGDWAGAEFLDKVGYGNSPHFYGGDRELGFILLQDLDNEKAESSTLVEPLMKKNNEHEAEAVLLQFATLLGQLHASTLGKVKDYEQIQQNLHPELTTELNAVSCRRADFERHIQKSLALLGLELSKAAREEIGHIRLGVVENPGPFAAFTHKDPCPDNFSLATTAENTELRILDFEFGAIGHALTDCLFARMSFPSCWCCCQIPKDLVVKMETEYRNVLSEACPQARDDTVFYAELVKVSAYWLLVTIPHIEPAWKEDIDWGTSKMRPRVLSRLDAFVDTALEFGHFPALRDLAIQVRGRCEEEWKDSSARLPLYPAFQLE